MENEKMKTPPKKKYHNMKIGEIINIITTLNIPVEEFLNESSSKYIDEYRSLMNERGESDV